MSDPPDWRLDNARHLAGFALRRRRYQRWSDDWDHDHCAACWAKFAQGDEPGILREGYATGEDDPRGAGYDWVCETCFAELQPELGWTSPDTPDEPFSAAC